MSTFYTNLTDEPSSIADPSQALNDDLHATFERWYPDLRRGHERKLVA
jgi:hypothetical protein